MGTLFNDEELVKVEPLFTAYCEALGITAEDDVFWLLRDLMISPDPKRTLLKHLTDCAK